MFVDDRFESCIDVTETMELKREFQIETRQCEKKKRLRMFNLAGERALICPIVE